LPVPLPPVPLLSSRGTSPLAAVDAAGSVVSSGTRSELEAAAARGGVWAEGVKGCLLLAKET